MNEDYRIDSFAAVVKKQKEKSNKGNDTDWIIEPLIYQIDGQIHPQVTARARSGIVPIIGDIVHVVTMINGLDLDKVKSIETPSLSNSIIVGILKANKDKLVYDYDREFNNNIDIKKSLTIKENLKVDGNIEVDGDVEVGGDMKITGQLIIGGKNYSNHKHSAGSFLTPQGNVTGVSGGVS